jgi:hypothetical protein
MTESPAATDAVDENLEALIDMTLADTFPASDPPCWTLGREPGPLSRLTTNPAKATPKLN